MNMRTSLSSAVMNVVTRLLIRKRYFSTEHTDDDSREFKEISVKVLNLCGVFNISDYVPFLKPFDIQGLVPQFKQTSSQMDRLFDRVIQEHVKDKSKSDESKDFLDVLLSLPGVDSVSDRLDDITIKAVFNVSCSVVLYLMCGFDNFVLNLVSSWVGDFRNLVYEFLKLQKMISSLCRFCFQ